MHILHQVLGDNSRDNKQYKQIFYVLLNSNPSFCWNYNYGWNTVKKKICFLKKLALSLETIHQDYGIH